MSLRKRVQGLIAAAVMPLSALLVFDAYSSFHRLASHAESTALNEARLLAGSIEAMLDGGRQAATAIATHMQGDVDAPACTAYLQAIVAVEPRYFGAAVVRPDGSVRCSDTSAFPDISVADRGYFQAALLSTELIVGELVDGRVRGLPSMPLALSYRSAEGRIQGVVILPIDVAAVAARLAAQFESDRGYAVVLDGYGRVAAQVPEHETMVGQRVPEDELRALKEGGARVVERTDHRQRVHIAGVVPISVPPQGLLVIVGLDRAATLAPARAALIRSLIIAAVAIASAILAAWLTGMHLIERPIRRFVDTAQRRAAGDLAAHFPDSNADTEFGRLGRALNLMAEEIDRLVEQKTLLLRELQHRVMNSLQLLSAFLHLQARQVKSEEVRRHLSDTRERILSMSAIYRHLYHSEATNAVDFGEALRALCHETARAYLGGEAASIAVDAESAMLPVDTALSLALITHELLTNAMKHAYDGSGGPLRVELHRRGDMLELAVIDLGKGLPPHFAFEGLSSLGMTVIQTLTRQLRGTLAAERPAKGAHFVVRIPLRDARHAG